MARTYGNAWARAASGLTRLASWRSPGFRWAVIVTLAAVWLVAGLRGWSGQPPSEALYRTLGAIGVQDVYSLPPSVELEIARFVGLVVPLAGLLFAFSGQLFRSLAQALSNLGAGGHVVVAGGGPAALALAENCAGAGDVVFLACQPLPPETAWTLRKRGVMLVEGDPTQVGVLAAARANKARHVVALAEADPDNLRIEAGVRTLVGRARRPVSVHVGMRSQALLQEAREMRAHELRVIEARSQTGGKDPRSRVESRPFSLTELAARRLLADEMTTILDVARRHGHAAPHLAIFGFDAAAEAVAVRALMTLWSAKFGPPRVTVIAPATEDAERHFAARYPHARGHEGMEADIAFLPFDWTVRTLDETVLEEIAAARGPVSGCVVSPAGGDEETITLALALLRACNVGLAWPVPIYMKEESVSEFSKVYASGDLTPDVDDAYLQAFGADQTTATRELILEGMLDQGAAVAHAMYQKGVSAREGMAQRELEALHRGWDKIPETYRHANRAAADHAVVKLWDVGWRPARGKEKGEKAPVVPPEMVMPMAEVEHARWCAERLLSGWRPPRGDEKRDNRLRIHPSLKPWDALTQAEKEKDADQVKAAMMTAQAVHRRGFMANP